MQSEEQIQFSCMNLLGEFIMRYLLLTFEVIIRDCVDQMPK